MNRAGRIAVSLKCGLVCGLIHSLFLVQGAWASVMEPANGSNVGSSVRFQRANLVVADMDRALSVYRDVLGLTLSAIRDLPSGGYAYEIFRIPEAAVLRFAVLSSTRQANVVALTEVKGTALASAPSSPLRTGLVLETDNFDSVIKQANASGLTVFSENKLITRDGRRGRQQGFVDHDGNVIVVYVFDAEPSFDENGGHNK